MEGGRITNAIDETYIKLQKKKHEFPGILIHFVRPAQPEAHFMNDHHEFTHLNYLSTLSLLFTFIGVGLRGRCQQCYTKRPASFFLLIIFIVLPIPDFYHTFPLARLH